MRVMSTRARPPAVARLAIHAEASLEAEKTTILREHDTARAKAYAQWVAGAGDDAPPL